MDRWEIAPFAFKALSHNEIRTEWSRWKRNFEYIVAANGEKDKTRLKFLLLAKAGPEVQDVFETIPGADVEEDAVKKIDPYRTALDKLDEYFTPKHHDSMERNIFWTLRPESGEPLDKFMLRAREQAMKCKFGKTEEQSRDISIIDKLTLLAPPDLKERLLEKDLTSFDDVYKIISSHQSVKYQASRMIAPAVPRPGPSGIAAVQGDSGEVNRMFSKHPSGTNIECSRCGRKGHLGYDRRCPAKNEVCDKCNRVGHYASKCRTGNIRGPNAYIPRNTPKRNEKFTPNRVRSISDEANSQDPECSDAAETPNFIFAIGNNDDMVWIKIGGVMTQILIDSGCNKNILDDTTWQKLKAQGVIIHNATKNVDQKFRGYGKDAKPLMVNGMFDSKVEVAGKDCDNAAEARFYVVQGGNQPLLGKETSKQLNLLRVGLPTTDVNQVISS